MKEDWAIEQARLDDQGLLHVTVCGFPFWAGEKYTILEKGWAVYLAEGEGAQAWARRHGETREAEQGCNELASDRGLLVTSHPVLVALALRVWWHSNGRLIPTAPHVPIPSFPAAVEEVRQREILNDFNARFAGVVPGFERWNSSHSSN